jgi:transposase
MHTQSNKLDFTGQDIFVGFDVHLKSWKVTIMSEKLTHKTFAQPPKPEVLYDYLVKNFPGANYHSAYEAGFCGYWIHNQLKELGVNSMVVNAADIPTTHKEKVQKEDKRDSRKIARELRKGELKAIHVPSLKTLEDRGLIRTRGTLIKEATRNKNRIKSFLYFHGIDTPVEFKDKWSKAYLGWLKKIKFSEATGKTSLDTLVTTVEYLRDSILNITRHIRTLSETEPYKEKVLHLRSIPGIGLLTAMEILTELEDIQRFKNFDHLCSFVGLVPSTSSTGDNEVIGDLTPRGHSILRSAIIESAWVAVRRDPALTKSYYNYCKRMESNKAIVRIARKLLNRVRFVLLNNKDYETGIIE